jgi:hypothetical protein
MGGGAYPNFRVRGQAAPAYTFSLSSSVPNSSDALWSLVTVAIAIFAIAFRLPIHTPIACSHPSQDSLTSYSIAPDSKPE